MARRRLVGLVTDFGAGSGYPAQLEARLLTRFPDARVIHVSHEVPPFGIAAGAVLLEEVAPSFPPGAVLVAVVDPGVGTARRGLVAEGAGRAKGRFLVGPDNGLLARLAGRAFVLPTPPGAAPTFHGRDVFLPAALALLAGERPAALGAPAGPLVPSPLAAPRRDGAWIVGDTVAADRFGNLLTNLEVDALPEPPLAVAFRGRRLPWVRTFGDARSGTVVAYAGSGGRLELARACGSLAASLRSPFGLAVKVRVILAP